MAVTYYVALPFIRTDEGTAPGEAQECPSEAAAITRAEGMSRDPANAGAVAFKRAGDPNVGKFSDAVVLKRVWRCAGRFERAATMVLLLRDDREPRLDLPCRRPILLFSSTSSTSPVSPCAAAMQRFGSDGSNSGHGGCALETALLTYNRHFQSSRQSRV